VIARLLGAVVLALAVALVAAGPGLASEEHPTLADLEDEVICPTCHTTLALSNAPVADQIRAFIRERIAAGDTKSEIKEKLVAEFGEEVLAAPPKEGLNLLAWVLPLVGVALAILAVGMIARRWVRSDRRHPPVESTPAAGRSPLDPELERRVDEELARFDA
jgi:cytochrome c-type biogenesis protein CcmH